jgi:hypothetical protein
MSLSKHLPPILSKIETPVLGGTTQWNAFPLRGPNGGRVVVDAAILVAQFSITVATLLWDGRDVPRFVANLLIKQRSGGINRWNTQGDEARICAIKYGGIRRYIEHANVAVGAGQAVALRLAIPFRKPFTKRGNDYSIGADELELIAVNWNTLGGMQTSTTVLSAFTGASAYWLLEWHEELDAEIKCVDIVRSTPFTSNTQAQLSLEGAVHDLDLFVSQSTNAGGGTTLAAITTVQVPELGIGDNLAPADLLAWYRRKRDVGNTGFAATPSNEQVLDPFTEGKAIPVITADESTSASDGVVTKFARVNLGVGIASCRALTRQIVEQPEAMVTNLVAMFGVDPRKAIVNVHDADPTRRGLGAGWTDRQLKTMNKSLGRIPGAHAA